MIMTNAHSKGSWTGYMFSQDEEVKVVIVTIVEALAVIGYGGAVPIMKKDASLQMGPGDPPESHLIATLQR